MTPLLALAELGFVFLLARRCAGREPDMAPGPVYGLVVFMGLYGVAAIALGARGAYVSDALLRWLPGLWLPAVPLVAVVMAVLLFPGVRAGLRRIADATPWQVFAYFHALRIGALGTAYKASIGEFPVYFELGVGVPDLLFGISALWIAGKARRGELTARTFQRWNLVGVLVIVPGAPLLIQLGLPGPLQLFAGSPDARVILTHPMSIAPVLGVPLFVLVNLWLVWRLHERRPSAEAAVPSLRGSSSCAARIHRRT